MNNITLIFSATATASLPQSAAAGTGTYKPTNYDTNTDVFVSPAPAGPYATNLTMFNGQSANGVWSLYVQDDGAGDQGTINGGWSLTITTAGATQQTLASSRVSTRAAVVSSIKLTISDLSKDGRVLLRVEGLPNEAYALETSEDLVSWKSFGTVSSATGVSDFIDSETTGVARRFYRVVKNP